MSEIDELKNRVSQIERFLGSRKGYVFAKIADIEVNGGSSGNVRVVHNCPTMPAGTRVLRPIHKQWLIDNGYSDYDAPARTILDIAYCPYCGQKLF